jgi:hypothetical protein
MRICWARMNRAGVKGRGRRIVSLPELVVGYDPCGAWSVWNDREQELEMSSLYTSAWS